MFVGVGTISGVASLESSGNSETSTGHGVANDERPSTTELVNKEDTSTFTNESNDRVDTLEQEDLGVGVTKDLENFGSVVLDGGNTGDLDRELEDDTDSNLSDVLSAAKDRAPAASGTLLDRELSLDLGKFGADKDVGGVTASGEHPLRDPWT